MTKTWTTEDELPQGDSLDDWDAIAHYGAIDMRRCIDDEVVDYPVGTVVLHVGPRGPSTLWKYYRHAEDWFDVAYYVRVE